MIKIFYTSPGIVLNLNESKKQSLRIYVKPRTAYVSPTADDKAVLHVAPKAQWTCAYGNLKRLKEPDFAAIKFKRQ